MQTNADLINLLFVSGGMPELLGGAAKTPDSVAVKIGFKEILDCLPGKFELPEAESQTTETPVFTPAEEVFLGGLFPAEKIAGTSPLVVPLGDEVKLNFESSIGGEVISGRPVLMPADEAPVISMKEPLMSAGDWPTRIPVNTEEAAAEKSRGSSYPLPVNEPGIVFETPLGISGSDSDEKSAGQNPGEKLRIIENYKIGFDEKDAPFANRAIASRGLIDLYKATVDVATNGEKGGFSLFPALTTLTDLENLEINQSLVLTNPANSEESAGTVRITKESEGQFFNAKTFTGFTVEFCSDGEVTDLKAVLVKSDTPAGIENNLAGLESLVEKTEGRDARLILFVPTKPQAAEQVMAKAANPIVGADLNPRGDFISTSGTVNPGPATVREVQVPDNNFSAREISVESSIQNPRPITETGQNPGANQEQTFSARDDRGQETFRLVGKQPEITFFEAAVEKQDSTLLTLPGEHENNQPKGLSETRTASSLPEMNQFKQVQFKLELPRDGIKIPEGGYFRIKLEPESLGKIDVQLKVINDQFVARMEVENPIARQVVEANLPQLRETLQSHGIKVENITVSLAGEGFERNLSGHETAENLYRRTRYNSKSEFADDEERLNIGNLAASGGVTNLKGSLSLLA